MSERPKEIGPDSAAGAAREPVSRLLRACAGLPVDRTPVWLMRQAGRYQPEYRALRRGITMLEAIADPELACAISLLPRSLGVDGLIVFSDILPPLAAMGCELVYVDGVGPRLDRLEDTLAIDRLACPPAAESMAGTLDAIRLLVGEAGQELPVIGFAGAPFTLASYAIEGGGTTTYARTKKLMLSEPAAWDRLMRKLVTVVADLLVSQANAGASLLQVFDSWVGVALSADDYGRYVAPYQRMLFSAVAACGVPVISFSTGTFPYLEDVAECGGDVIAIDWRGTLDDAMRRVDKPVMGNLDPTSLLAPWPQVERRAREVLARADNRDGYVFNLGHGVLPDTKVDTVRRLIALVHEETERGRAGDDFSNGRPQRHSSTPVDVLLMAYGGPDSETDLPGYLADIRSGRTLPSRVLDAVSESYRAIGGRSPLLQATEEQAKALQAELGDGYAVRVGMRHWRPWLEEVVRDLTVAGASRLIGVPMAPQYSELSVAQYWQRLQRGMDLFDLSLDVRKVGSYHDTLGLIDALADRLEEVKQQAGRDPDHVLFTAHSLPTRVLETGDLYPGQVAATAALVAERLDLASERWSLAYQSAGRTKEPWLGPDIDSRIEGLAVEGAELVFALPVGFVCDHVEVLYDLDVRAAATARDVGVELRRGATVGTHPRFITQLAELVRAAG